MPAGSTPAGESALRILRSTQPEVEALRSNALQPPEIRGLILRVGNAIDRSLRRMLRDDEAAELRVRLSALAPDELRADEVLAELRRNDRLPVELAAGVHELLETRRRLESGEAPNDIDRVRTIRLVEALEPEIVSFRETLARQSGIASADSRELTTEPFPESAEPVARRRKRRGAPVASVVFVTMLVLLVAVGLVRYLNRADSQEMELGVALFQQGDYAEAAQHFWRYAEANPDDVTPHLYLARIHRRMNRADLAAEAIRQAERIAPDDPAVHRELGFLLLDTGRPDIAVDRFRRAIALDTTSSEGWVGLVRALRESGRASDADETIRQAPAEVRALLTPADAI